jgi:WD40 repeat protein
LAGTAGGTVIALPAPWRASLAAGVPTSQSWSAHGEVVVTRLAYSAACGGVLATASRDATVRLWRWGGGGGAPPALAHALRGHELTVAGVDVSADGRCVASASRDCSVRLWDAEAGREAAKAHVAQNVATCVRWAAPGGGAPHLLLQGGEDLRVRLWDTRCGALRAAAALEGFTYFPLCVDAAPDGARVATSSKGFNGSGCEVRLWDLRRCDGGGGGSGGVGPLLRTFSGHAQDATACAFFSGGGLLASASKDGTVRVWDTEAVEGAPPRAVLAVPGAAFTSLCVEPRGAGGGALLAAGHEGGVATFEV